ncbi:unnamed protein product [Prorocentrum cordatum]|nr:unnamed protein product [Polarella glacialis]
MLAPAGQGRMAVHLGRQRYRQSVLLGSLCRKRASNGIRRAARDSVGAMNSLTLRFEDDGLEAGFASGRRTGLLRSLAACSLCIAVVVGMSLAMQRPWDTSENASRQQAHIMQASNLAFASCVGLATLSFAACCLLLRTGRVSSTLALEILSVTLTCIGMVLVTAGLPFYTGRVLGYDSELYLEGRHITDTGLLLSIDAFVTASHMALNVRFRYMIPIQVCGLICYVIPALILGSPEMDNFVQFSSSLLGLIVMAAMGKHILERQERHYFASLIREKSLRFQSEFQLSNFQAAGGHLAGSVPSAPSVPESVQSTTQSARKFMPLDRTEITPTTLRDIALVGEREQWVISRDELGVVPGRVLGEGGFGRVLLGRYQGISVAIKVPKVNECSLSSNVNAVELCNELQILRKLRHPNIVFMYGAVLDEQSCNVALVLELVQGVPLHKFVLPAARPPGEVERLQVLVDVTCALRYLHSRRPHVAHGDLKDGNVFVEPRLGDRAVPRAKLLDFGLARLRTRHAPLMGGTVRWAAPEVLLRTRSSAGSTAADVYSFGRLAFFVVAGAPPFQGIAKPEIVRMVGKSQFPPMEWPPDGPTPPELRAVLEECCSVDPSQRPSISRVHRGVASWLDELLLRQGLDPASLDGEPFNASWVFEGALQDRPSRLQQPTLPEPASAQKHSRSAAQKYVPTPDDTILALLLEVLSCHNPEVPEGTCCPFHGCLHSLMQVCHGLRGRECLPDWLSETMVNGQCSSCGVLFSSTAGSGLSRHSSKPQGCTFCEAPQSRRSDSSYWSAD